MRMLILALLFSIAATAVAQQNSEDQAAFEAEMKALKQSDSAKFEELRQSFTMFAEALLGRLGYAVGPFDGVLDDHAKKSLRAYEKSRGIPVTGNPLSFHTVEQVNKDMTALDYSPVGLSFLHVFVDEWANGYFSAEGTWVISGEEMAWPEQTSEFTCFRSSGLCAEATAMVSRFDSPQLSVNLDWYEIERWDEHEIVTKPKDFGCTRYVRRVNRVQKSVTGIRSTISSLQACSGIDRVDKLLKLVNGLDVYMKLRNQMTSTRQELLLFRKVDGKPPE